MHVFKEVIVLCFAHYGEVDYRDSPLAICSLSVRLLIALWYANG